MEWKIKGENDRSLKWKMYKKNELINRLFIPTPVDRRDLVKCWDRRDRKLVLEKRWQLILEQSRRGVIAPDSVQVFGSLLDSEEDYENLIARYDYRKRLEDVLRVYQEANLFK